MSIAHELSSDVAAAVLASKTGGARHDASELAEVVMEVHSILRRLTAETRRKIRGSTDDPTAAKTTS